MRNSTCLAAGLAWLVLAAAAPARAADPPAVFSLPDTNGVVGERIRLALEVTAADSMQAGRFDIAYVPERVTPLPETLARGPFGDSLPSSLWDASLPADSIFRIVFATPDPTGYFGSGTLVTFEVELIGGGTSPLSFREIMIERVPDIMLPAEGIDGSIAVSPLGVAPGTWGAVKRLFADRP